MATIRLKKLILQMVDNQLKAKDPLCTKDTYEKLLDAGYSESEAKEKIGAVILTEIYDVLKKGQGFDEEQYKEALDEMLLRSMDYEDDYYIETEWDEWYELVDSGYECFLEENAKDGLACWQNAWEIFGFIMEQYAEWDTVDSLMEETDYEYPIDDWLQDYEIELGNAGRHEERRLFCRKVLEIFNWHAEDAGCFRCGIGDSLFGEGKTTEAYEYFEKWLAEEPQNVNGIISFSWILYENGDTERAYEIVRKEIWGVSCSMENSLLFIYAKEMAQVLGKEDESHWYQEQLDKFERTLRSLERGESMFDEFTALKQIPVIKEKKIYPNDPCPCGSGKKYKKCCGKM